MVQIRALRAAQYATRWSAASREHRGGPAAPPTRQSELKGWHTVAQSDLMLCMSAVTGKQWHRRPGQQEQTYASGGLARCAAGLPDPPHLSPTFDIITPVSDMISKIRARQSVRNRELYTAQAIRTCASELRVREVV